MNTPKKEIIRSVSDLKDGETLVLKRGDIDLWELLKAWNQKNKKSHSMRQVKQVSSSMKNLLGRIKNPHTAPNSVKIQEDSQVKNTIIRTKEESQEILDSLLSVSDWYQTQTVSELQKSSQLEEYNAILLKLFIELFENLASSSLYSVADIHAFNWEKLSEIEKSLIDGDKNFSKNFDILLSVLEAKKRGIIEFHIEDIQHAAIRDFALNIEKYSEKFYAENNVEFSFSENI